MAAPAPSATPLCAAVVGVAAVRGHHSLQRHEQPAPAAVACTPQVDKPTATLAASWGITTATLATQGLPPLASPPPPLPPQHDAPVVVAETAQVVVVAVVEGRPALVVALMMAALRVAMAALLLLAQCQALVVATVTTRPWHHAAVGARVEHSLQPQHEPPRLHHPT